MVNAEKRGGKSTIGTRLLCAIPVFCAGSRAIIRAAKMPQGLEKSKKYNGKHVDNCRAALRELEYLNQGFSVFIYWRKIQNPTLLNVRDSITGTFDSKEPGWTSWTYTYDYIVLREGTIVWDGATQEDYICFSTANCEVVKDQYRFQLFSRPKVNPANWMGQLRQRLGFVAQQNLFLSSLTLPSTHNSHTISSNIDNTAARIANVANCQSVGVKEQLEMGIRSIDLRIGKQLRMRHGLIELVGHVRDVLRVMSEFLDAHPQETIMFQAKWDYWQDDRQPDEDLAPGQLKDLINTEFSARGLILMEQPALSECIGKMVLFHDGGKGAWEPKESAVPCLDRDKYGNLPDVEGHWRSLQMALDFIPQQRDVYDGKYYQVPCASQSLDRLDNHKNMSWKECWDALWKITRPCTYADYINPRVFNWMRDNRDKGRLGRVMLDFAEPVLVQEIILWNFDYFSQ